MSITDDTYSTAEQTTNNPYPENPYAAKFSLQFQHRRSHRVKGFERPHLYGGEHQQPGREGPGWRRSRSRSTRSWTTSSSRTPTSGPTG